MAVIGKIRKHSVLLLVVVAVALLAFILGDFIRPSNSGLKNFLKIGKYEISYFEYIEKYNYYSDLLRQNEAENIEYEANNYTFNEMVDSLILSKQTIPLGISVTPEELRDLMAGPNPHEYARRFSAVRRQIRYANSTRLLKQYGPIRFGNKSCLFVLRVDC